MSSAGALSISNFLLILVFYRFLATWIAKYEKMYVIFAQIEKEIPWMTEKWMTEMLSSMNHGWLKKCSFGIMLFWSGPSGGSTSPQVPIGQRKKLL